MTAMTYSHALDAADINVNGGRASDDGKHWSIQVLADGDAKYLLALEELATFVGKNIAAIRDRMEREANLEVRT